MIPRITLKLNHARIAAAETAERDPGEAIAEALRLMADQIASIVNVIPYGSGEWQTERIPLFDSDQRALGVLILDEVESGS